MVEAFQKQSKINF